MNKMNKLMVLASLLAAPTLALAGETAPMSVTGTFTPSSCTLSLDKTSIDMGEIPLGALATAKDYAAVPLTLTVNCGTTNTKLSVTATDNQEAPDSNLEHFGLGKVGSNQIGYYAFYFVISGSTLDGVSSNMAYYSSSFHDITGRGQVRSNRDGSETYGFATGSAWTAGKIHVMKLSVEPHINAFTSSTLTANSAIDGNLTLQVMYH